MQQTQKQKLAKALWMAKMRSGIKYPELAEKVGASHIHINRVLTGSSTCTMQLLFRIADALDLEILALNKQEVKRWRENIGPIS